MDKGTRRRIEGAMRIAGMNAEAMANEMGLTESTFRRRLRGVGLDARYQRRAFIAEVAEITGVGEDFFAGRPGPTPPPIAQDRDEPESDEEG